METRYPTQPGWYAIGMNDENNEPQFGPIYHFDGFSWTDEEGNEVDGFYDPFLQLEVGVSAADHYVRQ